jgi:hypothetical protein
MGGSIFWKTQDTDLLPISNPLIITFFITINAPLILKMREIIFFLRANYIMGHFKGYFEGAKTFLTPKLSRAQRGTILRVKKDTPCTSILLAVE